ncbi:MAG: DivIVA domain-containing protein [Candidatus Hydrogenedentes bacterium]|nr:DivIVA domain-containing protein [Candidatus Hydrogenedentota bacterium]
MKHDKLVSDVLGDEIILSPSDLLNQQFSRARIGGYDRRQVDDFIERVADVFEGMINQVRQLREKIDEQRKSIDEFQQMEAALRTALLSSHQHGEHMLDMARREANVIIEEAKIKRAKSQEDASKLPVNLARDIHLLENQRSRLRVEMLAILETHRRLIDSLVPEDPIATPVGFFEVGASTFNDSPLAFAEEPVTSVVERVSAQIAELGTVSGDQSVTGEIADTLEIPEEQSPFDNADFGDGKDE